jgi:hypothetical protein
MNKILSFVGDWGLGIWDWGLGIRDWPNPQSPIPNPQLKPKLFFKIFIKLVKILIE